MIEVIIIGAGAAGLLVARELSLQEKNIIVLEARHRIGGRIHTLTQSDFSIPIEAGAEFIHGNFSLTNTLLKEANLPTTSLTGKSYHLERGEVTERGFFDEGWDDLLKELKNLEADRDMGSFLRQHFNGKKSLIDSVTRMVQGYDAADINKISAFALRDEWTSEDSFSQHRVSGGYGKLMQALQDQCLARKVAFHVDTVVEHIEWRQGYATIKTNHGEFQAEKVILTVPIAVLANHAITFDPPIPTYIQAVRTFGFGGVVKFVFEFKESFWEKQSAYFRYIPSMSFLFSDAAVPTWWTQLPEHAPLLTGWLAGPRAEALKKNAEELYDYVIETLAYISGADKQKLTNEIAAHRIFNWINDPYARGAYAYKTPQTQAARTILSQAIENTLYFAGEALYDGPEMGTVEAALRSGKKVAGQLMEF